MAGLARQVHDSSTLKEKFDKLVSETKGLEGNRTSLVRRVPTRWNSDLDCLLAHFYFKEVVEQFTAIPSLGLKHYSLSDSQWKLAEDVREILLVRAKILIFYYLLTNLYTSFSMMLPRFSRLRRFPW